ncbi:MAG: FecR domain-containing protein [Phycisphaerae bacterium]|nr:FecR domain-containing protein [Phycisphaerae bacterium]
MKINREQYELIQLLTQLQDGQISQEDFARLESLLSNNKEAVKFSSQYLLDNFCLENMCKDGEIVVGDNIEAELNPLKELLEQQFAQEEQKQTLPLNLNHERPYSTYQRTYPSFKTGFQVIGTIACLITVAIGLAFIQKKYSTIPINTSRNPIVEPITGPTVATLIDQNRAIWAENTLTPRENSIIAGSYNLKEGYIEIRNNHGVMILLQGPCEFQLNEENSIYLIDGNLVADVPKNAIGFTVETISGKIVDFGTEFGVSAQSDGHVEAHVYQGLIELRANNYGDNPVETKQISVAQAGAIDCSGQVQRTEFKMDRYVRLIPLKKHTQNIKINNHSFEMDGQLTDAPREPNGWQSSLPIRAGAENQPWRGNLPGGGFSGNFVGFLNSPIVSDPSIISEIWQNTNATFITGKTYTMTVSIGRRQDHDTIHYDTHPLTPWKISIVDAYTGKELSAKTGIFHKGEQGVMLDQHLRYTASPEVFGHRIQIRITNPNKSSDNYASQLIFDNVRLTVTE